MKENNELIAEFMGINVGEYTSYPEESPTQYAVGDLNTTPHGIGLCLWWRR